MTPVITIYTDGSALGNPGPGGYGVVLLSGPHRKELSQGFRLTTNNRMELMAVCVALEALKIEGSEVTIYSEYNEQFVVMAWIAFVLLLLEMLLMVKKNPRLKRFNLFD